MNIADHMISEIPELKEKPLVVFMARDLTRYMQWVFEDIQSEEKRKPGCQFKMYIFSLDAKPLYENSFYLSKKGSV